VIARALRRAALALTLGLAALPAAAEGLADALVSAYNHSRLLEQNRALLRATDEEVASSLAALRPIISWAAGVTHGSTVPAGQDFSSSVSLNADLLLWDFGRSKLATEVAKESVLATREALISVEQNVLLGAVQAYMNVIRAREFVSLRQNNLRLITQELRAARDRFELGEVTQTDVSIAEARLALSRANLAAAEGDLFAAGEQYVAAIGHPPGQLSAAPSAPSTARTLDQAKSIGQRTHPSIRQAQREVTINELSIAIAEAALKPTLSLSGRAALSQGGTTSTSLSLNMSGPIYRGGSLSSQIRGAIARRDAARAALLQSSILVTQNIGIAWANVSVAAAQLQATDRQIRASRVAFRGVSEEATLGARTTLDVLNAEQELLDAEAGRISAYTDYYVATYALLREMGLLTAAHLGLGIVAYDPEAYYNAVRNGPIRKVSPQGQKLDRVLKAIGRN
jgi:outer membrane protein